MREIIRHHQTASAFFQKFSESAKGKAMQKQTSGTCSSESLHS